MPVFLQSDKLTILPAKNAIADNQRLTKKMHFLCIFFAKIFAYIKKKQ